MPDRSTSAPAVERRADLTRRGRGGHAGLEAGAVGILDLGCRTAAVLDRTGTGEEAANRLVPQGRNGLGDAAPEGPFNAIAMSRDGERAALTQLATPGPSGGNGDI